MKTRAINSLSDCLLVANILYACGKDMSIKHDLHHWDNPWFKSLIIVILTSFKNNIFIVQENNIAVATYQTKIKNGILYFEKLAVLPSKSGKGIGSLCLKTIEEEANIRGCLKIQMDVYSKSTHAIDFYKNHGYREVGENKTFKFDIVCMEKKLTV